MDFRYHLLLYFLSLTYSFVHCTIHAPLFSRSVITESDLLDSYDFIVVGGGLAGLVLASRLSEDAGRTVLVLEAGDTGDAVADQVDPPAGAYYTSIVGTDYDWKHETVAQQSLAGRIIDWPRGKILGGSSAMNAMYLVRPSDIDVSAWEQLITSQNGTSATRWGWPQMYEAMKKSETFTPPLPDVQKIGNISFNASNYGSQGPMNVSYPGFMLPIVGNWTKALESNGVRAIASPNGGNNLGGFVTPSSINPTNWTRSYSRSAYIGPLPPRSNLHILAKTIVTRLLFSSEASSDEITATGVEVASSADTAKTIIAVNQEVILSAGALGSPKVLLHSGVGPQDILQSAGIDMKVDLPGVGQHLQDHLTAGIAWVSPNDTAGDIRKSQSDFSKTREFWSFINNAVAFLSLQDIFGAESATVFQNQVIGEMNQSANTIVPSKYPEVVEGYKAVYNINANTFLSQSAQIEMLLNVMSSGEIYIQAALQHPLSHGRVYINSSNPFDPIVIDPQYYSHSADIIMMRQGLKFVRRVAQAMGPLLGEELWPGPGIQSDEQLEDWLRNEGVLTQYHPTASCSMLPRSQGGVVDADLRVYGLANVRVVDSSVYPFEFAAHLGSVTYGVAEQAASMIRTTVPVRLKSSGIGLFNERTITSFYGILCCIIVAVYFTS